jgi:hypothetical protein
MQEGVGSACCYDFRFYQCINLATALQPITQGLQSCHLYMQSLYFQSESCVRVLGSKSVSFPVGVGLGQGCALSPIMCVIFMDRTSRHSRGGEDIVLRTGQEILSWVDVSKLFFSHLLTPRWDFPSVLCGLTRHWLCTSNVRPRSVPHNICS